MNEPPPPERPHRFYRLIAGPRATAKDFLSHEASGFPLKAKPTAADVASWRAVSTFTSEDALRERALEARRYGRPETLLREYIAVLDVPDGSLIAVGRISRTGHCDLTADPQVLLAAVVNVIPV